MRYDIANFLFNLACRIIRIGSKRIIKGKIPYFNGPVIYVSNHPLDFDCVYFYDLLNNPIIMMNDVLFSFPIIGSVLKGKNFIPVPLQTEKKKERRVVYNKALEMLQLGHPLFTCPEAKLSTPTSFLRQRLELLGSPQKLFVK